MFQPLHKDLIWFSQFYSGSLDCTCHDCRDHLSMCFRVLGVFFACLVFFFLILICFVVFFLLCVLESFVLFFMHFFFVLYLHYRALAHSKHSTNTSWMNESIISTYRDTQKQILAWTCPWLSPCARFVLGEQRPMAELCVTFSKYQ